MLFNTPYERKNVKPVYNPGKRMVETAGYIPAKRQIEDMILAGQRLNQAREEMFDFPDGKVNDAFYDPTREPNFDLADASQILAETTARIEQQKADAAAAKAAAIPPVPPVTPA